MIWLGIDTANQPLSVAVVKDGIVLSEENSAKPMNHSLRAMPAVHDVCKKAGILSNEIDAIAVAEGPGSYTGVRIGVTIAKTLAWTLQKPLIGVSSLKILAANVRFFNGFICPLIDARRQHVYTGFYQNKEGHLLSQLEDGYYPIEEIINRIEDLQQSTIFVGADVVHYEALIKERLGKLATFATSGYHYPRATLLVDLASGGKPQKDLHAFVPQYRRMAEAEANWLKEQNKGNHHV